MDTDFQAKVERYEGRAAKCKEAALQAAEGAQRTMYEVLSAYYSGLASDFRQVIEKRDAA